MAPTPDGQLVLLLTSPRVVAGQLTRAGWQVLETADAVCCADLQDPTPDAVAEAGLVVRDLPAHTPGERARLLVELAQTGRVVWLGSPDADPGLTDALAAELSRLAVHHDPPPVEVLVANQDVAGARLLDVVAVMDRLRSPDGCPWDAEQSHASLVPYLVEETYEAVEALESGDRAAMREELGDVLLQVVFHARLAQEHPQQPFDVDDVAAELVDKLVRRHPHVFAAGDAPQLDAEGLRAQWDAVKAAEKGRAHVLDGIPPALPALARADKVIGRLVRAGQAIADPADPLAAALLRCVQQARGQGRDAETVLRAAVRELELTARTASWVTLPPTT